MKHLREISALSTSRKELDDNHGKENAENTAIQIRDIALQELKPFGQSKLQEVMEQELASRDWIPAGRQQQNHDIYSDRNSTKED